MQLENQGGQDITQAFQVTLFEDSDGDGTFTPPSRGESEGGDNVLGQATHTGTLAAGASTWLPVPVSGQVLFRDNLIYAFADSGDVIEELDENNNLNHSGMTCEYWPPPGEINPVLEWQWISSTLETDSDQVLMTPAVVDLTADGTPDVVFITSEGASTYHGVLRAIDGRDGSELFSVTNENHRLHTRSHIAVGDIDLDGWPEILAEHEPTGTGAGTIDAFEHNGVFKWQSLPATGNPAIADLDQDGTPEIVVGATVLNNDGTVRWSGAGGRGDNGQGPLSLVADLDLASDLEVVAGNTAYHSDGSIYWQNTDLTDGLNAVADFDDDAFPEVVLVTQGKVYLLEHDGTVKWGPALLPGDPATNLGGPPTVADLDGDGEPEIGVASGTAYTVFEADGSVKWSSTTEGGAGTTAGTAFDFDGDGSVEIVYADAYKLRICRGSDGTVLWETASRSGTTYDTYQMPVVADVDADGHAEIIMGSNNIVDQAVDFPGPRGIQVYGDLNDRWVPTRQIWNQHTYHVTNVDDDGAVPQVETANWQLYNNYRINIQTGELPFTGAPNLSASYIRVDVGNYPTSVAFTARIGNGGATDVPAGLRVAFYDGDPAGGGSRLGSTITSLALAPGEYEDVTFVWTTPGSGLQTVYVVADDDNAYDECNEANNIHSYQYITGPEGPDLTVPLVDATATTTDPRTLAIQGTATAQIHNQGSTAVSSQTRLPKSLRLRKSPQSTGSFDVTFFEDLDGDGAYTSGTDNTLGQTTHTGGLAPGATISVTASLSGSVRFVGAPLWAFADSGDTIPELDETNNLNQTATQCQVDAAPAPDLSLSHLMAEPADLSTGTGEQGSKGAEEQRSGGAEENSPRHLGTSAPQHPGSTDLTVRVANAGEAPVGPGIPVSFYLGDPAAGGALLGNSATTRILGPDEYEDVTVRWTDATTGTHTIFVTVDAAGECDEADNIYSQRVDILDIPLVESWNLISGWVNPFYTDVGVVQRPISGTFVVILGFDGGALVYYPDLPAAVNTLKEMDAKHGYWVKIKTTDEGRWTTDDGRRTMGDASSVVNGLSSASVTHLRLVGTAYPENRELALDAGWNLVSFLSRNEMGVMEGLRSIDGQYTAALGFDQGALSYYPYLPPGLNTLSALEPLRGYWIRMSQEATLRYPRTQPGGVGAAGLTGGDPGAARRARLARQAEQATGVQPTNTWVNFYGPALLLDGAPVPEGALVRVFDADRVPCGAGIVTVPGQYGLLACYGDDPTTPGDEGASAGDVLTFTINGQPVPASQEAVWTAHGDLRQVPLGAVRLWRVWLPLLQSGDWRNTK